MKKGHP